MEQSVEERKAYLSELNEIARYTATLLHGDEVTKVRIKHNNKSFKYGYGGKILVRKIMLDMGMIEKQNVIQKKAIYTLLISPEEINLELVSRIIVEVYLTRNDIQQL